MPDVIDFIRSSSIWFAVGLMALAVVLTIIDVLSRFRREKNDSGHDRKGEV